MTGNKLLFNGSTGSAVQLRRVRRREPRLSPNTGHRPAVLRYNEMQSVWRFCSDFNWKLRVVLKPFLCFAIPFLGPTKQLYVYRKRDRIAQTN